MAAGDDDPGNAAVRRHLWIEGRVQGVFFRGSTADEARNRDLGGFVRNLPDGRVEAVFEGEPETVEAMIRFCRRGPPAARVDRVEIREETPEGLRDFTVLR